MEGDSAMLFLTLILYTFSVSAVFSYGIGLHFLMVPETYRRAGLAPLLLKDACCAVLTTALLWYPAAYLPLSFGITAFLPAAAVLVPAVLDLLLSVVLPSEEDGKSRLFSSFFVFGIVFLSLREGMSFLDAVWISLSCALSFVMFLFLFVTVLGRLSVLPLPKLRTGLPLFLILAGLFSLFPVAFDVIWAALAGGGFF